MDDIQNATITPGDSDNENAVTQLSKSLVGPNDLQLVFMFLCNCTMVLANIPVFVIVPRVPALKNSMGYMMLNLAMTDVLLAVSTSFYYSYWILTKWFYRQNTDDVGCLSYVFTSQVFASVSILSLTLITIDKYLTLSYPHNVK